MSTSERFETQTTTLADHATSLRRKLSILCEDIKEIRDQGKRAAEEPSEFAMFKGMYSSLNSLYRDYSDLYYELNDIITGSGESIISTADSNQRSSVKRFMQEATTQMQVLTELHNVANSTSRELNTTALNTSCCSQSRARAKLPTIPLIKFNGERTKWTRFRDLFESLVIGDDQLREIDKYHYLVSSLEEPAAAVISKLAITEANFRVAWQSLKEAYDNKRLLACTYLDQLFDLKALPKRPSHEDLGNRIALLSETVSAIKLLRIEDLSEFLLFHLACKSLDPDTRLAFENSNSEEFPKFESLITFVRKRCTASALANSMAEQTSKINSPSPFTSRNGPPPKRLTGPRTALVVNKSSTSAQRKPQNIKATLQPKTLHSPCVLCGEHHRIAECCKFTDATPEARLELLKEFKGCRNCLHPGHSTRVCPSKWRCRTCNLRHHSLLHLPRKEDQNAQPAMPYPPASYTQTSMPSSSSSPKGHHTLSHHAITHRYAEIMLGTAICLIGPDIPSHSTRIVLDSGSHCSFITIECAQRLGLQIEPQHVDIWGIGETPLRGFKGHTLCQISPCTDPALKMSVSAIVVESITSQLPGFESPPGTWEPYMDYELADPSFWVTRPVDFLLGCDLFSDVVTGPIVTIAPNMPRLLGTIFGYTVLGRIQELAEAAQIRCHFAQSPSISDGTLETELHRFWSLEEPPATKRTDPLDDQCEQLFLDTHRRTKEGRYEVRLPFRSPNPFLPGSRNIALKRLTHLESKLERNAKLKEKYHEFMHDYLSLGHMQPATRLGKYIIPHHCVVKEDGADFKVRVVFDAAARTPMGSLNDHLLVGPKLQACIAVILLNFRLHEYVFTADAIKMFRQILVSPEDCQYQHILWRFNTSEKVQEFTLRTVSYGQSSAPYLANRVILQLKEDEGNRFPLAKRVLAEDIYVDDIASGANTVDEAVRVIQDLIKLMACGGFRLSKWAANHPDLLAASRHCDPKSTHTDEPISLETSEDVATVKILGLQWDSKVDEFMYKIIPPTIIATKRGALSATAKVYDPLGYLAPAVVLAKIIVQEAWKRQLGWDDHFPEDLAERWSLFIKDLPSLGQIRIPRKILTPEPIALRLLIFSDASERAYCASAFLHVSTHSSSICNLIMAKTKLAPVKSLSIPRLELCAALLAGRVRESLIPFCNRLPLQPSTLFFTDSTIVLAWLKTPTFRLKTFVANRVETIYEITKCGTWHHILSAQNPSDLGSRGVMPTLLASSSLWYHGPSWTKDQPETWPLSHGPSPTSIPDTKPVTVACAIIPPETTPNFILWMERFSSFSKLIRSLAYALRFLANIRRIASYSGPLSLLEIRRATNLAIKAVQAYYFFNSNHIIPTQRQTPKSLISLHPIFDDAGLLTVGGRLSNSQLAWSAQHQIILPQKAHLSKLIMEHYHRSLLHPGATILLAALRSKYWIIGARSAARRLARSCTPCRRHDAPTCRPHMGNLPDCRFKEGRAFRHVGMDFAGPFLVRESTRRKAVQYKCYLGLFICLTSRALHLEAVTSLSTEAFFAALRRFVGRRGLPEKLYSDHGTNFVGARNQLAELYAWLRMKATQDSITEFLAEQDIEWSFTPPTGATFGGGWEAGVKSVKRLMRTIYGDNALTYEQLSTLFVEIERILNSRPLCPLSSDPSDISCLTPGHLAIGTSLLDVPAPSLIDVTDNRLSQWEIVEKKAQHFWRRWRQEYVTSLQVRGKWKYPDRNLQVGDLVFIKEETSPRKRWPMARITQVHPGKDNIVRVVTLKISRGKETKEFVRPANKLVPLFPPDPKDLPNPSGENYKISI